MGFAPMNDPKIAIAVYVENGGFGATYRRPYRCDDDGSVLAWQVIAGE